MPRFRLISAGPGSARRRFAVTALLTAGIAAAAPAGATASSGHSRRHHPTPTAQPAADCANANTPASSAPMQTMRVAVDCLINQQRTSRGLPPLHEQSQLERSAQNWTNWLVANNQFTHGTNFAARITAVGYLWQTAGENIASGFATPNDVVNAWMASPDHCHNILDPSFYDVGTGMSPSVVSSVASGSGTWTQDFGLKMTRDAPSHNSGPADGCPYG